MGGESVDSENVSMPQILLSEDPDPFFMIFKGPITIKENNLIIYSINLMDENLFDLSAGWIAEANKSWAKP